MIKLKRSNAFVLGVVSAASLAACSSGPGHGSGLGTGGGGNSVRQPISMVAPTIIQSGAQSDTNYAVISNNTSEAIDNISFAISDEAGTGINVNLAPTQCTTIAANSNCVVSYSVANADGVSGSFRLNLHGGKNNELIDSRVIGVQSLSYDSQTGLADGVSLFYNKQVPLGTKYILVTGVVASSKVPSFNEALLTSGSSGKVLPNQQVLSGNLGSGLTALSRGNSFSILVNAPQSDHITQYANLKLVNTSSDGQEQYSSYSNTQYSAAAVENQAIINILPAIVNLTKDHPQQIITLYNRGDSATTLGKLMTTDPDNIEMDYVSGYTLKPNEAKTVMLKLKNVNANSNLTALTIEYDNSKHLVSRSSAVGENLGSAPSGTFGVLPILSGQTFSTSEVVGKATNILTLINKGVTAEHDFTFELPKDFSLAAADDSSCVVADNVITSSLEPEQSCNVRVVYKNNVVTPQTDGVIKFSYQYAGNKQSPDTFVPISYQVTKSFAILGFSQEALDFGLILNDNNEAIIKSLSLSNSGDKAADITTSIESNIGGAYKIVTGEPDTCGTNLAPNTECKIYVQFGPSSAKGNKVAQLSVASQDSSAAVSLKGNIVANAIIKQSVESEGFAVDSDGSYFVEQNHVASFTYTFRSESVPNEEPEAAKQFYVAPVTSLGMGWEIATNTCGTLDSPVTLNGGNSCEVKYQVTSNSVGTNDFNLSAHWVDSANVDGSQIQLKEKVSVFSTPHIVVSTNPEDITETLVGESFSVNFSLTGGHELHNLINNIGALPDSHIVASASHCEVSSESPNCAIVVRVGESTPLASNYSFQTSNTLDLTTEAIKFSAYANDVIILTRFDQRWGDWRTRTEFYKQNETPDEAVTNIHKALEARCNNYAADSKFESDFPIKKYRRKHYEAFMFGQGAFKIGTTYYRGYDGLTKLAVAESSDLMIGRTPILAPIRDDIVHIPRPYAPTENDPKYYAGMATTGAPWHWEGYDIDYYNPTCSNWTEVSSMTQVAIGLAWDATQWGFEYSIESATDMAMRPSCSQPLAIYCVSQ